MTYVREQGKRTKNNCLEVIKMFFTPKETEIHLLKIHFRNVNNGFM